MWEIKETSPAKAIQYGHTTIGLTATQLTPLSLSLKRGVVLRAPGLNDPVPNTGVLYVGKQGVTANASIVTDGIPMPPGATFEMPIDDPSQVYVVATVAGQDICWMGV